MINGSYNDFGDTLFPYITHFGNGILSVIVVVALLFYRYRLAIIASLSFLLSGITTQALKHSIFTDALRPVKFFEGQDIVHTVSDVVMHMFNSFPSGHATTAFALFFMLAIMLKGKKPVLSVSFLVLAVLGGYSRVYLGQHFPADVLAGSFIGVAITGLCFKILNETLLQKPWSSKGLINMQSDE